MTTNPADHVHHRRIDLPTPAATDAVLYTPAQAARWLKVRESWLRRQAAARLVPSTRLGRHLRFSPADLAAIVAAGAHAVGRRPHRRSTARDLPRPTESSVHAPPEGHTSPGSS